MSEPMALTLISFIILITTHVVTRTLSVHRIREAACGIVQELDLHQAYDPITAVELPLVRRRRLRAGYRNFRPHAVEVLARRGLVKQTAAGKFYLRVRRGTASVSEWCSCG